MTLTFEQLPEVVKVHTELLIIDKNLYNNRNNTEKFVADLWNYGSSSLEANVYNSIANVAIRSHLVMFKNEILTHRNDRNRYVYNEQRLTLGISNKAGKYKVQAESLRNENSQLKQQNNQEINSLKNQLNQAEREKNTLQRDKNTLNTQLDQAKRDKTNAEKERDNLKKENEDLRKDNQDLKDWDKEIPSFETFEAKIIQQPNYPSQK
ncbi:coiled-coil domain-containing protein [endosymbiont GvMRE of Glomus versiforme]|uniref:coiled-coil domain-containing protein n=1 Tax=endosymbiont GvMRE of Glomus versiforme TaxID=2039283 RepID=UPI000ED55A4C|nr:hypothetical protein [endosymbiont GvMRE of Glomus versiforme]RHZ37554.1 hypothetical protein GvMRE_I1g572 [endosymbiont GvMRE of Glomus versiforme]